MVPLNPIAHCLKWFLVPQLQIASALVDPALIVSPAAGPMGINKTLAKHSDDPYARASGVTREQEEHHLPTHPPPPPAIFSL
ncbi:hypothetical protein MUK42_37375 [Musa troglodytarum]|uniref:Uncharacterized protein n=1 Tax=Musa troglodytarum TaxID=320322 RepID=A0A9E7GSG0_9LILI|nr:hypothetical protein MUK42_37375 [Musa troglodytarum]